MRISVLIALSELYSNSNNLILKLENRNSKKKFKYKTSKYKNSVYDEFFSNIDISICGYKNNESKKIKDLFI